MTGRYRAALRLAFRSLLGSPRRHALVAVMVALPVALATAASVLVSTAALSPQEQLPAVLGSADDLLSIAPADGSSFAAGDTPDGEAEAARARAADLTTDDLEQLSGGRVVELAERRSTVDVGGGRTEVTVVESALSDPVLAGMVELRTGSFPQSRGQLLVNPELADRGVVPGATVRLAGGTVTATVVGVARSARDPREPRVFALPGLLSAEPLADPKAGRTFLVDRGGVPISAAQVGALSDAGVDVRSRADVLAGVGTSEDAGGAVRRGVTTVAVVAVMVEVVLLAGPAFAVGVRRQRRDLALVRAAGGRRRDVAMVVLCLAAVLGVAASVTGALLAFVVVAVAVRGLNTWKDGLFGPFDVVWWQVDVAVVLGAAAAVMAAWVPARQAARMDVVEALSGRPGPARPARRPLVAAAVLLGAGGVVTLVPGRAPGAVVWVAAGFVMLLAGAVLAMPALLFAVGVGSGRLPVTLRLAARDVRRNLGRSAPAAAAVLAAVAGVSLVAITAASALEADRRTYVPRLAESAMQVPVGGDDAVRAQVQDAVRRAAPHVEAFPVHQIGGEDETGARSKAPRVYVAPPGCPAVPGRDVDERCRAWRNAPDASADGVASTDRGDALVMDVAAMSALRYTLSDEQRDVLRRGGVLVLNGATVREDGTVKVTVYEDGTGKVLTRKTLPALPVVPRRPGADAEELVGVLMTPATARALSLQLPPANELVVPGAGRVDGAGTLEEAVRAVLPDDLAADLYTETGYRPPFDLVLPGLTLGGAGVLAVLIGTLTATGLAMSEGRRDMAVLTAIGAAPSARRRLAASHAVVVGAAGSVTGVAVGALAGVPAAWLATRQPLADGTWTAPVVDVPWVLVLTICLAAPALAAATAALGSGREDHGPGGLRA